MPAEVNSLPILPTEPAQLVDGRSNILIADKHKNEILGRPSWDPAHCFCHAWARRVEADQGVHEYLGRRISAFSIRT